MNTIVCQCAEPATIAQYCVKIDSAPISSPTQTICMPSPPANRLSPGGRGGRLMLPFSAGSIASASPGNPSVTRFTHRIWIGSSGSGMPKNGATSSVTISPVLPASTNRMNLRMFS